MAKTVDLTNIAYYVTAVLSNGSAVALESVAENIAWEENESELSVRLNLTIRDIPYSGKRLSQQLPLCTAVYLYAEWGEGKKEIFQGTVWEWEHSEINDDQVILTCYDLLYYLQKSADNKYYPKGKKTKYIIKDILDSWGVALGTYTGPDVTHEKIVYKSKSVSAMLIETLKDAKDRGGYEAVVRASEGAADIVDVGSNKDVYGFTADANLIQSRDKYSMVDLVTRVVIIGKEDKEGRPKVEATIDGSTEYGVLQSVQSLGSGSISDAKTAAQKTLDEKGKPTRTITLQAPDLPFLRKGDVINVQTDHMSGYFTIKGISHNATAMTMQMEVKPYE